ncbi:ROK family protein [Alteromonas oceanisediminis]|uniref:ROK family protein n=1 Tax=Alteromonas oceanisediminis TaxID=2836180 RepID=UPI001BD9F9A1|nr:ROK family protein [Alteromonas oceanisediminis]MBT0586975.1 ROK family protein [Alteromonas oceanisediminis]
MTRTPPNFAVIEAGGTKFNCAVVSADRDILREQRVATTSPDETLADVIAFFQQARVSGLSFEQLGVASFGPLDLNPLSATYGNITQTPKPYWSNAALLSRLTDALNCRGAIDTDVNAAALAESRWGAGIGAEVVVYITVGTGVGGGVAINGQTVKGLIHPEIGHLPARHAVFNRGCCPFHSHCVEGFASGTAMASLWGQSAETLAPSHEAWDAQADVLAQLAHSLLLTLSPNKIIFGGGVMQVSWLLPLVITKLQHQIGEYLRLPDNTTLSDIIQAPGLGTRSGLMGALALVCD